MRGVECGGHLPAVASRAEMMMTDAVSGMKLQHLDVSDTFDVGLLYSPLLLASH